MLDKNTDTQPSTETKGFATKTTLVEGSKEVPEAAPNSSALTVTQEDDSGQRNMSGELSTQRDIADITTEIILHKGQIVHSFIEIGKLLIEAKAQLANGHGCWLKWLSTSVDISERMAQRYMQLAEEYANTTSVSDLGITKALALLTLPEVERETFISESHEINGKQKKINEMSTREIKNAIRGKKEATTKSENSLSFKPINRDDNRNMHSDGKQKPEAPSKSSDSLESFASELESAQKHLDCILGFLAEQTGTLSCSINLPMKYVH